MTQISEGEVSDTGRHLAVSCCAWIVQMCEPGQSVALRIFQKDETSDATSDFDVCLKPFGFQITDAADCDILVVIDCGEKDVSEETAKLRDPVAIVREFEACRALKMFYFRPSQIDSSFSEYMLDLDRNLLDHTIELPLGSFQQDGSRRFKSPYMRFSLLVLDKNRNKDGRTDISFTDASAVPATSAASAMAEGNRDVACRMFGNLLEKCPSSHKDFRNIFIRKEPILAPFQVMKLSGPCRTLDACTNLCRVPPFSSTELKNRETLTLNCLSPKSYAPFGYTEPSDPEIKEFPEGRIKEKHKLKGGDILLIVQGSIGKACIIEPGFEGQGSWIPTSFTVIIRPKEPEKLDPRVLFMYLTSETVKRYLTGCSFSSGSIPIISGTILSNLPVPTFSDSEKKAMTEAFERLHEIRKESEELMHRFYRV